MANFKTSEIETKNKTILNALQAASAESAQKAETSVQSMSTALKEFANVLKQYIELNVEKSTIVAKYSGEEPGGAYNLPGVFSSSAGSYDLTQMKADNQKLQQVIQQLKEVTATKELYTKIIERSTSELRTQLKVLSKSTQDIEAYLLQLEEFSDWQTKSQKR